MYTDILDTINREQEVRENINYEIIIWYFSRSQQKLMSKKLTQGGLVLLAQNYLNARSSLTKYIEKKVSL